MVKNQKRQRKKKKRNNGGMSLVEVIIAMVMLSLVVIPVLQALTTSAYYNQKARKRQNITALAESVMENFKGYSLQSIEDDIFGNGIAGAAQLGITIADNADIGYTDAGTDSVISFYINNIQSDNVTYNMEITATPSVKEEELFEIENASAVRDAIYKDEKYDSNIMAKVISDFQNNHMADVISDLQVSDKKKNDQGDDFSDLADFDCSRIQLLCRTTTYQVTSDGTNNVVKVSMTYTYKMEDHPWYKEKPAPAPAPAGPGGGGEDEGTVPVEDESETGGATAGFELAPSDEWFSTDEFECKVDLNPSDAEDTRTIYNKPVSAGLTRLLIYYFPAYQHVRTYPNASGNAVHTDEKLAEKIEIKSSINIDCYLIKQKNHDMGETQLTISDEKYDAKVKGESTVRLFHNLNENLGRRTASAKTTGIDEGSFNTQVYQYTGADFQKKRKVLAYSIHLQVTDEAGNVLTELVGSMNEKYRIY